MRISPDWTRNALALLAVLGSACVGGEHQLIRLCFARFTPSKIVKAHLLFAVLCVLLHSYRRESPRVKCLKPLIRPWDRWHVDLCQVRLWIPIHNKNNTQDTESLRRCFIVAACVKLSRCRSLLCLISIVLLMSTKRFDSYPTYVRTKSFSLLAELPSYHRIQIDTQTFATGPTFQNS